MSNVTSNFQLSGLHCESCKKISEKRIKKIKGVTETITNIETGELAISGDRAITKQEVITALEGTDYQVN
ncbi:MAG: hypothetical protein A3A82_03835 [Candidatus Pacebacteria bacterium RIFCSPLOWO2_01_FULL_47_12]|nr:MAG: hypothetical protein A3J60_02700 [Candidatus Pacebacteria bacterium RIFCSPHIGHO2_02_FULL_46_9]OGJ39322.1 MAG: hypothetical protein A3A82_03835 [Candidatus Pacebacteria bacterium RIFCSPLOWO2_01_FULL_47_12]